DLQNLIGNREEILKAEVGSLLFNLGKTHIGFWREKYGEKYFDVDDTAFENIFGFKPFKGYESYHKIDRDGKSPFEFELEKFNLKHFILNQKVNLPDKTYICWIEFFKGGASGEEFIQQVFFKGCENVNSGIDKGFPKAQIKASLWLSNAFGSLKKNIEEKDLDQRRLCFFKTLSVFLNENNYLEQPKWEEIRNFVLEKVKKWYSKLLSDSRFPVNDVSLWDQAYMTSSMFKAALASSYLNSSLLNNYKDKPTSIKWRILGIQYDKLGLAEKGLKPSQIRWYREAVEKIDNEIKNLLEIEYPIGNEVYRDETGIYFVVGENIGEDKGDFAELRQDLKEIQERILDLFKEMSDDEFYPAVFLTKASSGLMNLTYLLEKAK
ncbi:MAG: CRISPR-associated protein Csx11, partial [Thermodesulfobacterium geofontis]